MDLVFPVEYYYVYLSIAIDSEIVISTDYRLAQFSRNKTKRDKIGRGIFWGFFFK